MNAANQQTLGALLQRTARRVPDKLAIVCGDVRLSFAAFDAACSRLASGLQARGVARGDRVAVLARNSHAFATLRFALARLGAVLVPVNFMLREEDVAFILRHSGASLLAVDSGMAETGRRAAAMDTRVRQFLWLPSERPTEAPPGMPTFDELCAAAPPAQEFEGPKSSELAQIVYTSGTESLPKGAMLTHEAVIWQYTSCIVEGRMSGDDLFLHSLPLYHCAQLDCFLGPALHLGATSVITDTPTPENLLPLIERHRITSFFAPPTVWIGLLRSPLFDRCELGTLAKGYYGASIMPVAVLQEMQRRLPQVRLWNFYGQTEIAPLATALQPEDQMRKPGSAGRPVLNVETRIVDDAMRDVPADTIGEIVHRSPQLMSGYYQDPQRTAAAFEGGWFHSGDLAVMDEDGYLTIVDRKKDMIKTGGENVASREVEEALYGLDAISEVAVVGLPHPHWVEAVTAIVVLKPDRQLDEPIVLAHCRERLAPFKVPKGVVMVDSLPKNPSGKLLKRELRERFATFYANA